MLSVILLVFVFALIYRLKRERELVAETLKYYSDLTASLSTQLQKQKELATSIGHDLKSPLAGIISSAESLEMVSKALPATYLECLKLMRDSGRTNLRMLSNFIDLVADKKATAAVQTLPQNRKETLRGLLPGDYLQSSNFIWLNCPYDLKISIALRPFACALAELVDIAKTESAKSDNIVEIEETVVEDSREMMISLRPMPDPEARAANSHYQVALRVLERLGVKVVSARSSEVSGYLDMYLPLDSFVRTCSEEKSRRQAFNEAEILLSWSVQQVHSAKLSVSALTEIPEKEEPEAAIRTDSRETDYRDS